MRPLASLLTVVLLVGVAAAQTVPLPAGHKLRVSIDSAPQGASVYINDKQYGLQGYTPITFRLPKGTYKVILELPGYQPLERQIVVTRSGPAPTFVLDKQARPAVLDVRSVANDSASNGQLYIDGAPSGKVPSRLEVPAGRHLVEVKKPGYNDYRGTADLAEGETRTMVIELQQQQQKGAILVTADVAGADVWVDGQRRDAAPALITDLPEGDHTVEVRKDPLPAFRTVVRVEANRQAKVEAHLAPQAPQVGSFRVLSTTPGAEVFVDGQDAGPANSEIKNLSPGKHLVEVRAKGYQPQSAVQDVVAGEARLWQVELAQGSAPSGPTRLRIVTPVPDAEVFIDGASVGHAPVDRNDLPPGKHFVVVRAKGFAEWQREINLQPGPPVELTAQLSDAGTIKVISNVAGADVYIDGQRLGQTPFTTSLPAGEHFIEVKKQGYQEGAKLAFRLEGGQEKLLPADLVPLRTGPAPAEYVRIYRGMTSWGAVTVEPNKFTADIYGGFFPFGGFRLTVGAWRKGFFGIDAGVEIRTIGYLTEGLANVRAQLFRAGPIALGARLSIGGGGGPAKRDDFVMEVGLPFTLLFADIVRFTAQPYLQVYSDKNCPNGDDIKADLTLNMPNGTFGPSAHCNDPPGNGFDPRARFSSARLMLQAALEIALSQHVNLFFIFEGSPTGERAVFSGKWSPGLLDSGDPQIYGRAGITFKF